MFDVGTFVCLVGAGLVMKVFGSGGLGCGDFGLGEGGRKG